MPHADRRLAAAGGAGGADRRKVDADREDLASTDEVKVYEEEGEEESRSSEHLSEDKLGLVTETEEGKGSDIDSRRSYSVDEASGGVKSGALKSLDYVLPDRLPFGYPFLSPFAHFANGPFGSPGKLFAPPPHPGLGLYMYGGGAAGGDPSAGPHPPPAHMGITALPHPPLHLDLHSGLSRHPVYGLHPSLYPPDLAAHLSHWGGGSPGPFRGGPYPPLGWLGGPGGLLPSGGLMPPHPSLFLPGRPTPDLSPRSADSVDGSREPSFFPSSARQHPSDLRMGGLGGPFHPGAGGFGSPSGVRGPAHAKREVIKKPLNAFMIFMKEMRQSVIEECSLKESAAINQILGRRWHALERADQQKYYEMARKEKELHMALHPGWSARDNYATHTKKKKTKREHDTSMGSQSGYDSASPSAKRFRPRFGDDEPSDWCQPTRSENGSTGDILNEEEDRSVHHNTLVSLTPSQVRV